MRAAGGLKQFGARVLGFQNSGSARNRAVFSRFYLGNPPFVAQRCRAREPQHMFVGVMITTLPRTECLSGSHIRPK